MEQITENEKEYYTLIMGDFNAKIGEDMKTRASVGKWAAGVSNIAGENLADLADKYNLKIVGTYFKGERWIWRAPNGKIFNEIDHALINDRRIIRKFSITDYTRLQTDHRLGICDIVINKRSWLKNNQNNKEGKRLIIPNHKIQIAENRLEEKLADRLQFDETDVQTVYDIVEKANLETCQEVGNFSSKVKTDDKLSIECKELIEKRTKLKEKAKRSNKENTELTELNKLIRIRIRQDIRNFDSEQERDIIEETWSTKQARKVMCNNRHLLPKIRKENGSATHDRAEIIGVATEFYRNLYKNQTNTNEDKSVHTGD